MRDDPHESKSLDEGEPRETTSGRKEKKQGKRKERHGGVFWGREEGKGEGETGCAVRNREGGRGRGTETLRAEQVLSPVPREKERVPRLSPKAEKVLSARSYLSLSVVAVASGHDQSEVSIPGYQSAPSAYIIVRSLGHCLSTVVNHILFPRLRFRFIYLSEKRIATVLVASSRAPAHARECTGTDESASALVCRWTHVQNRETRIL